MFTSFQLFLLALCASAASAATCADKVGISGYSDCINRVALCNNPTYLTLMTQQCPVTCGRCPNGSTVANSTDTSGATLVTSKNTSTTCQDKVGSTGFSDCYNRAHLCNNPTYFDLMTSQCPATCGRCNVGKKTSSGSSVLSGTSGISSGVISSGLSSGSVVSSSSSSSNSTASCADKVGPSGQSDCPGRARLCNDPTFFSLMTSQCPATCGRCNVKTSSG